jgi:tetratricopeptide (TPR) repeat protein
MRAKRLVTTAALILLGSLGAVDANAQQQGPPEMDAGKHFRRGVELYAEANYSGALVEFKRACALAPTSTALYNIGETEFQLQLYAEALKTFRQFVASYGPNDSHRASVDSSIQVLASRVGLLRVTTNPNGANIALDDEPVGKTPLGEPLLVSVGRRKLVASLPGRPPATQYVEVATGDDVAVSLELAAPPEATPVLTAKESRQSAEHHVVVHTVNTPTVRTVGWVTTTAFAVGALTFGAIAISQANTLSQARNELTTSAILNQHSNLVRTFSILADSFGAAAVLTGGVTLYWTLAVSGEHPRAMADAAHLTIGPASASFETSF